jgi:hypothetical protein
MTIDANDFIGCHLGRTSKVSLHGRTAIPMGVFGISSRISHTLSIVDSSQEVPQGTIRLLEYTDYCVDNGIAGLWHALGSSLSLCCRILLSDVPEKTPDKLVYQVQLHSKCGHGWRSSTDQLHLDICCVWSKWEGSAISKVLGE